MESDHTKKVLMSVLLVFLPISSSLCIDMYLPAYENIAQSFHVTEGLVNLSMSIYLFGLSIGQLIYGPLADRYGRRKILMAGLVLFIFATLGCALATTIRQFLVFRLIQAIGACSSIVLCRTIVVDSYHPEKRTAMLAFISAANIFSPALAPLLGGSIIKLFSWRYIFMSIFVFGFFMLIGIKLLINETLVHPDLNALKLKRILSNAKRVFSNRLFVGSIFCIAALYANIFVWVTFSPSILINYFKISSGQFGLYFLLPSIGSTAGALFTAKFSSMLGSRSLIMSGLLIILFSIFAIFILNGWHMMVVPFFLIFFIMMVFLGSGATTPQLVSDALSQFTDIGGFSSSVVGFLQTISGSMMGIVTSHFYGCSEEMLPWLMLSAISVAILSFLFGTIHLKSTALIHIKKHALPLPLGMPRKVLNWRRYIVRNIK